jgi:hypothetical protein
MALMSGITLDLLPLGKDYPRMTGYDFLVIHTLVGWAPDGEEAHWTTNAQGNIVQRRDTIFQSEACYLGNPNCLTVENEDHGETFGNWDVNNGHKVPPFTREQCEALARICVWAYRTYGIPLVLAPNSKPGSRGIAYHRQGIDGNFGDYDFGGRVEGGIKWSRAFGKVCPGDARIHQIIDIIIPRARVLAGLDKGEEEEEMANRIMLVSTKFPLGVFEFGGELIGCGSKAESVNLQNAGYTLVWVENPTIEALVALSRMDEKMVAELKESNRLAAEALKAEQPTATTP